MRADCARLFGVCEKFQVAKRLGEVGVQTTLGGETQFLELALTPPTPSGLSVSQSFRLPFAASIQIRPGPKKCVLLNVF